MHGRYKYLLTVIGEESDIRTKTLLRALAPFSDSIGFLSYHTNLHTHALLTSDLPPPELFAKLPKFRDVGFRITILSQERAQSANNAIQIKAAESNPAGILSYVFSNSNFQPFICAAAKRQPIFVSKRLQPELARTTSLFKKLNEMYAARKRRQDAKETVSKRASELKFLHIMETYFADIQLPPFLFAHDNPRDTPGQKKPALPTISPAVARIAVFDDPTSPYFNIEDRRLHQKYAMAARDLGYAETYDYIAYPPHCYDRLDRHSSCSIRLRLLELRQQHDLQVLEYVAGTRKSIIPPLKVFSKLTPIQFRLPSQTAVATSLPLATAVPWHHYGRSAAFSAVCRLRRFSVQDHEAASTGAVVTLSLP